MTLHSNNLLTASLLDMGETASDDSWRPTNTIANYGLTAV